MQSLKNIAKTGAHVIDITLEYFDRRTVAELMAGIVLFEPVGFPDDDHRYFYYMFANGHRQKLSTHSAERYAFPAALVDDILETITNYKKYDSLIGFPGSDDTCFSYKNERIVRRDIDPVRGDLRLRRFSYFTY